MQALLVSGGSDGLLILWSADHAHDHRELVPKLSLKVYYLYNSSFSFYGQIIPGGLAKCK